jgi:isoamylase
MLELRVPKPSLTPGLLLLLLASACGPEPDAGLAPQQAPVSIPDARGTTFRVFSAHATRLELWLFAAAGDAQPTAVHVMQPGSDGVWTARVEGARVGALYGLRAWGPNWPYDPAWAPGSAAGFIAHVDGAGNRFNPNKLLLDPYAKAVTGDVRRVRDPVTGALRYDPSILGGTDEFAFLDSAGAMPKAVVVSDTFSWGRDRRPGTPAEESVVYEVHLRGFTRGDEQLPYALRGTYDGFARRAEHLVALGVTAVELLPVQEFLQFSEPVGDAVDERVNYWGYMTHGFFAPNQEFLCPEVTDCRAEPGAQVAAMKRLVKALHAKGIEVWLDVVYNHTGEGGTCGGHPMRYLSFRGLDNQSYYTLTDDRECYWDSTGTGNNLNASSPAVQALVLDSLRYWIDEVHVDGFRFDLAYTLGRTGAGGRIFQSDGPLLMAIAALGREKGVKMVAEAWDTQGYGVGNFPDGWMEWNGRWRDNVRRFAKGDGAQVGALGASIAASHSGFTPPESVDFVTAHDGFTLNDLVTYGERQNGLGPCNPSGADPFSGSSDNDSWDTGGDEVLRRQQLRNFMLHLATHQGPPMLVAGDEMRRTQYGNNNAYMADNACGWLRWSDADTHKDFLTSTQRLLALRAAHPGLGRPLPLTGRDHDGDGAPDLAWHGVYPDRPDWSATSRSLAFTVDGSAAETGAAFDAPDLYVAFNAYWQGLSFYLPNPPPGQCWFLAADTAAWAEPAGSVLVDGVEGPLFPVTGHYYLQPRSGAVLMARACDAAATVKVDFLAKGYVTQPGERLAVVGSSAELGAWDPARALPLAWSTRDTWRGAHFFSTPGARVEYKLLRFAGEQVVWESGSNRSLTLPTTGSKSTQATWRD